MISQNSHMSGKPRMPLLIGAVLSFAVIWSAALSLPDASYADQNSPPDESVQTPDDEQTAQEGEQKKSEGGEKARRTEEARKRAEAAAKREAEAEKAAAEKRDADAMRRAASEDLIRTPIAIGRNLVENGRYRSAVKVLRSFIAEQPDIPDAWYWISRAYHALGDYDSAQSAVTAALDLDPYYPDLVKTPSGLQPMPQLNRQQKKEPRPSMSVLPVKPPLPANLLLEPVVISFPVLVRSEMPGLDESTSSLSEPDGYDPITGAYLQYEPYPPFPLGATVVWMQSEKFNEISRWRFRVDRMGMLLQPRVPIAWKGNYPHEVYFWTGSEWARVRRDGPADRKETFDDILNSAKYSIAEVLNDRGFQWYEPDTPALAAAASLMRYKWMGDIDLLDAEIRAEERAGKLGGAGR
jgi:hypothetical protein